VGLSLHQFNTGLKRTFAKREAGFNPYMLVADLHVYFLRFFATINIATAASLPLKTDLNSWI
jgi:hypothetical protein